MKTVLWDTRRTASKEDLHDLIERAFDHVSGYGRNFDAMNDVLSACGTADRKSVV